MKEGIIPLFDDPLADEVLLAMPTCNEYGMYPPPSTPHPRLGHLGDNQNDRCPSVTLPLRILGLLMMKVRNISCRLQGSGRLVFLGHGWRLAWLRCGKQSSRHSDSHIARL